MKTTAETGNVKNKQQQVTTKKRNKKKKVVQLIAKTKTYVFSIRKKKAPLNFFFYLPKKKLIEYSECRHQFILN